MPPDAMRGIEMWQNRSNASGAFSGFKANQVGELPARAFGALQPEQVWEILRQLEIGGLEPRQLGALQTAAMGAMSPGQLRQLPPDAMPAMKPAQLGRTACGSVMD